MADHTISLVATLESASTYQAYVIRGAWPNLTTILYLISNTPFLSLMVDESSNLAINEVVGKEGGIAQYLGSEPQKISLSMLLQGSNAKTIRDLLVQNMGYRKLYRFKLEKMGQTWFDSCFRIERVIYSLVTGTGLAQLNSLLELEEVLYPLPSEQEIPMLYGITDSTYSVSIVDQIEETSIINSTYSVAVT